MTPGAPEPHNYKPFFTWVESPHASTCPFIPGDYSTFQTLDPDRLCTPVSGNQTLQILFKTNAALIGHILIQERKQGRCPGVPKPSLWRANWYSKSLPLQSAQLVNIF